MKAIGVYLHIPFCERKCLYCDFNSGPASESKKEEYIKALIKEVMLYKEVLKNRKIQTLFIGGGTPSSVPPSLFEQLLIALHSVIDFENVEEFSIEANPGTISEAKLALYKRYGINRISFGVQSFNDKLLKRIGRLHNRDEAIDSIRLAKQCGFDNINIDLMHNLPEMTANDLRESIDLAVNLGITHLSMYSLILEEGTPLFNEFEKQGLPLMTEEDERKVFHDALSQLEGHGFHRYEVSNFALDNKECKHNLIYWHVEDYIGLGLSAHGKYMSTRYHNEDNIEAYINSCESNDFPIIEKESLSIEEEAFEAIMLGLRLSKGIHLESYYRRFSIDIEESYADVIKDQLEKGTLIIEDGYLLLTTYGHDVSNSVIIEFME